MTLDSVGLEAAAKVLAFRDLAADPDWHGVYEEEWAAQPEEYREAWRESVREVLAPYLAAVVPVTPTTENPEALTLAFWECGHVEVDRGVEHPCDRDVCSATYESYATVVAGRAAATPDPPDESHAVKCAEARGYARGRFERDPAASPDPPDLPALDEGPLAYLLEDSAASPDERLREALDNLLAAVTDVERRGEAGLIEALDDAMNDAADLLAAADRETARPDPETEAGRRVEAARIVAEHWATWAMREGDTQYPCRMTAHPLGCVLAALDGEITPDQLGVSADSKAGAALHSLAAAGREKPDEKVRAMTLPDGEAYCPPPVSDDPTGITRLATAALAAAGREKPDEPHTQDCQDAMFMHHAATGGDMECTCRPPVSDDPVNDPETNT